MTIPCIVHGYCMHVSWICDCFPRLFYAYFVNMPQHNPRYDVPKAIAQIFRISRISFVDQVGDEAVKMQIRNAIIKLSSTNA